MPTRSHPSRRSALMAAALIATATIQTGCASGQSSCWDGGSRSGSWATHGGYPYCSSNNAGEVLIVAAVYLAIAIPYLIAEACRSCD